VSSANPLEGLAVAVTRQTRDGRPPGGWLPDQVLSLPEALRAYTEGVAFQAFEEDRVGVVEVGRRADLCLLGADLSRVSPGDIAGVPVLGTWLAGEEVYRPSP
jgi:predicted amidohydrolase YtcJ